ncbi:hypothetical protein D3C71_916580 [compost metagenome]
MAAGSFVGRPASRCTTGRRLRARAWCLCRCSTAWASMDFCISRTRVRLVRGAAQRPPIAACWTCWPRCNGCASTSPPGAATRRRSRCSASRPVRAHWPVCWACPHRVGSCSAPSCRARAWPARRCKRPPLHAALWLHWWGWRLPWLRWVRQTGQPCCTRCTASRQTRPCGSNTAWASATSFPCGPWWTGRCLLRRRCRRWRSSGQRTRQTCRCW